MTLLTQIEKWTKYWRTATDLEDVERQLGGLRWLEELAFHCGSEITPECYEALKQQIDAGENKLAELTVAEVKVQAD